MGSTTIHSEWFINDALVGRDGFVRTLWSPATFARKYYGGFDHFSPSKIISTTAYAGFDVTALTGGTLVMADRVGGWLYVTGGGAAGQGIQMQSDGAAFLPTVDKDIFFEASVEVVDADDQDWFVGMASLDTNIFSTDPTELIAFRGDDGDVDIDFQVRESGTGAQADTGSDMSNTTAIRLGFWVKGTTSVTPYINNVAGTAVTVNLPSSNNLRVTFGNLSGATTASATLRIDWYRVLQIL